MNASVVLSLHDFLPACELRAGDTLLDEDLNPVGVVLEVAHFTVKDHSFTSINVQGEDSKTIYSFESFDDYVAVLREDGDA